VHCLETPQSTAFARDELRVALRVALRDGGSTLELLKATHEDQLCMQREYDVCPVRELLD
jgi:hypothetical protein